MQRQKSLLETKQIGPLQRNLEAKWAVHLLIIKLSPIALDDKDYPNAGYKLEFDFGIINDGQR
jgi:DNA topoisomerase-3